MTSSNNPFFAIISPARSRSSYIRSLLHSHPDVVCHSELFHQNGPMIRLEKSSVSDLLFNTEWRDKHPRSHIELLIKETQRCHPDVKLVGCKLLLYAYQINRGLDAVLDLKPRIILLTRANKLAWYSSIKIAIETGVWFVREKRPSSQPTITFKADEFSNMLEIVTLCEKVALKEIENRKLSYMKIECDELLEENTLKNVLSFLDLSHVGLSSEVAEQNTSSILNRFNNQADVIKFAASIGKLAWIGY